MNHRIFVPVLVGFVAFVAPACEFSPEGFRGTDDPGGPDASPDSPDAGDDPSPDAALPDARPPDAAPPDAPPDDPPTLTFTTGANTTQRGSTGGQAYNDACPAGEVLVGFSGQLRGGETWHSRITGHCGAAALVPDGSGGYEIAITPATTLPTRGLLGGGQNWSRSCPADQMVIGFDGRSGSLVDQLEIRCAALSVTGAPDNLTFSRGSVTDLDPAGGNGGSNFADTDCSGDQIARVVRVRAGDDLDAFGLGCASASAN